MQRRLLAKWRLEVQVRRRLLVLALADTTGAAAASTGPRRRLDAESGRKATCLPHTKGASVGPVRFGQPRLVLACLRRKALGAEAAHVENAGRPTALPHETLQPRAAAVLCCAASLRTPS